MNAIHEVNMDGLPGPTHHYAGLSFGNLASEVHAGGVSNPRAAALQGIAKMDALHGLGLKQLVMPPHPRPAVSFLRALGFSGDDAAVMAAAAKDAPHLLTITCSSSGMWAANAATVAASEDSPDGKVHMTPANLISTPHRVLESTFASRVLQRIFPDEAYFTHHLPLPASPILTDEGAANHMRLHLPGTGQGVHVFVYGKAAGKGNLPARFPARQHEEASRAIARNHRLDMAHTLFLQQSPTAIDAGVFHNDVIATSNDHLLLYHESAYADGDRIERELQRLGEGWYIIRVREDELPIREAIATYLFNSQIVTLPGGGMLMFAPMECEESAAARALIERWCGDDANPITGVRYMDLRQSMRNGGGPACLRLRLWLNEAEWQAVHPGVVWSDTLSHTLKIWVKKHYRDRLRAADLADPELLRETQEAYRELELLLGLEGVYGVVSH